MTTNTTEAPLRVRDRKRPAAAPEVIEVAPAIDNDLTPDQAKAEAIRQTTELLRLKEAANAAIAAANKAERALAKHCKQHDVPLFAVKSGEKVYDVGEQEVTADEVDVVKLFAEIGPKEAMSLCKVSQGAVTDYGGKPLLAKVLTTVTKPAEFKVKKRA